jgi:Domain of unknown function (DUF4349)
MTTQELRRIRLGACAAIACIASGLVLSGCAGSPSSSAAGSVEAGPASGHVNPRMVHGSAPMAAAPGSAAAKGSASQGGQTSKNAAIPLAAGSAIVYTAGLTVRTGDVANEVTRAEQIATASGGYVSNESTSIDPVHPALSTASLELKIPVAMYQATIDRLAALGTQVSRQQQAQDVTENVADVTSRVASAQAAIAQLRTLLSRASSIGDLLNIQDQISQQESELESLQAQQRALDHETTYATVSLQLVSNPAPVKPKRHAAASGFTRGLSAGWRALRTFGTGLLTVLGALIPFAVFVAAAAYLAYRGRRWLLARRTPPAAAE